MEGGKEEKGGGGGGGDDDDDDYAREYTRVASRTTTRETKDAKRAKMKSSIGSVVTSRPLSPRRPRPSCASRPSYTPARCSPP